MSISRVNQMALTQKNPKTGVIRGHILCKTPAMLLFHCQFQIVMYGICNKRSCGGPKAFFPPHVLVAR